MLPDLRYSGTLGSEQWFQIGLDGMLQSYGMVSSKKELSKSDAAAVRNYVVIRVNQSLAENTHSNK